MNKKKIISKEIKRKVEGITLIALVVTIIVLLILAGVAINLTIGSNGIFTRGQNAVDRYEEARYDEEDEMNKAVDVLDQYLDGKTDIKIRDIIGGDIRDKTIIAKDDNNKSVVIPGGFGVAEDSESDINKGVVIKDANENEFVWVPVNNIDTMIKKENTKLNGVTTTTDVYSNLRIREEEKIDYSSVKPGDESSSREPDILSLYDVEEGYYKEILGYNNILEMANDFVQKYKQMIDSIDKYDGFYIGRYELTGTLENPKEKAGKVLDVETAGNWYNLYNACEKIVDTDYAKSMMIYGCQWDETCSWLEKNGYNTTSDSSSWGNYNSSSLIETGTNNQFKANNIYDFAGNYWEWTQEANSTNNRVDRGGRYDLLGSKYPAADRGILEPSNTFHSGTTRAVLYVI